MPIKAEVVKVVVDGVNVKNGGVKGTDGIWYNLSKFNTDLNIQAFAKGSSYELEVAKGKGGALYIQKIISSVASDPKPVKAAPKTSEAKPAVEPVSYEKRGTEIGHRGFVQAAVVAASNISLDLASLEGNLNKVLDLMDKVLEQRVSK